MGARPAMLLRCRSVRQWRLGLAALALAAGLLGRGVGAPGGTNGYAYTPQQHRAWYIYLIAQYTEWPKDTFRDASDPFVIGILGDDPFGKDIDIIRDKPLKNRPLVIKRFKTVEDLELCHVLYISPSEADRLDQIVELLNGTSTLTIAETDGFLQAGGIVNLWREDDPRGQTQYYLRFEINRAAADKARLRISSYVLNLAKPQKNHN